MDVCFTEFFLQAEVTAGGSITHLPLWQRASHRQGWGAYLVPNFTAQLMQNQPTSNITWRQYQQPLSFPQYGKKRCFLGIRTMGKYLKTLESPYAISIQGT